MKRIILLIALSCYIVSITGGCASLVSADKSSETIKPSGIHEDCMEGVVYGITKDGVSGDKGTFRCEKKQYHCLMWTNPGSEPVDLVYSYSIKKK
jgi:hypothetical protein